MTIEDMRSELEEICRNANGCENCQLPPVFGYGDCILYCYSYEGDAWVESVYKKLHCDDTVNHPAHYQGAHECIEIMKALFGREAVKAFCRCNAFKYRFRADKKNGEEDIKKAEWYEDYLIKMEQEDKK